MLSGGGRSLPAASLEHWCPWYTSSSNIKSIRSLEVSHCHFRGFIGSTTAAYTIYAFFEWALVLFDVAFDAVTAVDFDNFEIVVKDVTGVSRGYVPWLPK